MRCSEVVVAVLFSVVQLVSCFNANFEQLFQSLDTCVKRSQEDIECLKSVQKDKQLVFHKITEIKDLRDALGKIKSQMEELDEIQKLNQYAPEHSERTSYLKDDLKIIGWTFTSAHERVNEITNKLSQIEQIVGTARVSAGDQVISKLQTIHQKCTARQQTLISAHSCVHNMDDESVKTAIQHKMDTFTAALNDRLSFLNNRLYKAGDICSSVRQSSKGFLDFPEFTSLLQPLSELHNKLQAIVEFFAELKHVVESEICVPRSADDKLNAIEHLLKRLVDPEIQVDEEDKECFKIAEILEEPEKVLPPVVEIVKKIVEHTLKKIPDFNLPLPPNFHNIYNFDINGQLPDFNLQLDTELYQNMRILSSDCAVKFRETCETGNPDVLQECFSSTSNDIENLDALRSAVVALRELTLHLEYNENDKTTTTTPSTLPVGLREVTNPEFGALPTTIPINYGPAAVSDNFHGVTDTDLLNGESDLYGDVGNPESNTFPTTIPLNYGPAAVSDNFHGVTYTDILNSESDLYGNVANPESSTFPTAIPFSHGPAAVTDHSYYDVTDFDTLSESGIGGQFALPGDYMEYGHNGEPYATNSGIYFNTIQQQMLEIKDMIRVLNEKQLSRFIVGLKQLVLALGKEKGRMIVKVIHKNVSDRLAELLQMTRYGSIYRESEYPYNYTTASSYPVYSSYEEFAGVRPLRSLLDVLKEGDKVNTEKPTKPTAAGSSTSFTSPNVSPASSTPENPTVKPTKSQTGYHSSTATTSKTASPDTPSTSTTPFPSSAENSPKVIEAFARYLSELMKDVKV